MRLVQLLPAMVLSFVAVACTGEPEGSGGDAPVADGGTPDAGLPADPYCEAPPLKAPLPQPITNGQAQPTLYTIPDGAQLAVGALLSRGWGGRWSNSCTATLIGPDAVLTAAHCVLGWRGGVTQPDEVRFGVGLDMDAPMHSFEVRLVQPHPGYDAYAGTADGDIAILRLKQSALEALPDLVPIAWNRDALAPELVGTQVQVVGYGATSRRDSSNSKRWWATEVVHQITDIDVVLDGRGQSAVCFGDSGGPILRLFGDELRTMGIVSWGDPSCRDKDHFSRVDRYTQWIEETLAAGDLAANDCGDIDAKGSCSGTVARRCEAGKLVQKDCGLTRDVCGVDAGGAATCLPDPCGGITAFGSCDGDTAVWCEGGEVKRYECGRCGLTCGYAGELLGSWCR